MKILDLLGLTELVELCKNNFASLVHKHKIEDIENYTVDDAFSATSTNPIQNKAVNSALLAMATDLDEIEGKLDSVEEGATKTIIDTELSSTSTNPVENKAVQTAIQTLEDKKANKSELPSKTSDLTNDSGFITVTTVNTHNTATDSHGDIRLLVNELTTQVENFLDVDDTTKDQLSELIVLIEENADDIESITSGKVNVSDIIDNLTTNVTNKPLSAAQGVVMKSLVDAHIGDVDNPHQILEKIEENSDLVVTELGDEIVGDSPELDPVVESRISEIETEVSSLKSDFTELETEVANTKIDLTEETVERKAEIAIERARIDALTSLPEGSTIGDAELNDARVDKDGNVHTNVGEHVRSVTNDLSIEIANLRDTVGTSFITWEVGAFGADGITYTNNNKRLRAKEFIDITNIKHITTLNGYEFKLYFFDSDHNLLGYDSNNWYSLMTFTDIKNKYNGTKYVHIVLRHADSVMILGDSDYVVFGYSEYTLNGKLDKLLEVIEAPSGLIASSRGTLFSFDERFDHGNKINIYSTGYQYTTDFDIKSMKKVENGVVYISPYGSDDNNGTKESPFFTISKCIESGANTIRFADGVYYLITNFVDNLVIEKELNFIADNEAIIYFGGKTVKRIFPTGKMTIAKSCYFENITFYGGSGLIVKSGDDLCFFNHCKFTHASRNGLNLEGKGAYLYKCEANDNWLDGFNYHADGDIKPTSCVEIECKGFRNGNVKNRSSNGSTVHDDGRIIRLNCEYGYCHGGIVADSDSLSYNFGVYAHDSTNNVKNEDQYNSNFYALSASVMWLYGCVGSGSRYMLGVVAKSNIYTDTDYSEDKIYNDGTAIINIVEQ